MLSLIKNLLKIFPIKKILSFFLLFNFFTLQADSLSSMVQEAEKSYKQAENASAYQEQKQAFNHSLYLYSLIEQKVGFFSPSLEQALGDNYFQLDEYAWAALHYQRALKFAPYDEDLVARLARSEQKLGMEIVTSKDQKFLDKLLSFWPYQIKLTLAMLILSFFICSADLWWRQKWLKKLSIGSISLLFLLFLSDSIVYYSVPLQGILITSTGFYRAPDKQQTQLTNYPLIAGSKVNVLQLTEDEDWVKITDSFGTVGYIPSNSLRLL